MKRVLVVDTDRAARNSVRDRLQAEGHEVLECGDAAEALRALQAGVDAVVSSGSLPDLSTSSLLGEAQAKSPGAPLLLVASSSQEMLRALRQGAYYVTRCPLTAEEISALLERALEANGKIKASTVRESAAAFVGESAAIRAVREAVRRLARDPLLPVLVTGEVGTGKRSLVRLLHSLEGSEGPFVSWSPKDGSEVPFESALAQAQGGTLFLSEVTLMPVAIQMTLLEALKHRDAERDGSNSPEARPTRICATSSRNVQDAARDGAILPELASRVAMARLDLPPLRERLSDIPLLVEHFTQKLAASGRCMKLRGVTEAAMATLMKSAWPGNVRELCNALEGAALLSDAEYLDVGHFASSASEPELKYTLPSQGIDFRELERDVLVQALRKTAGNQTRAALLLGLTRDQIRYRMAKFGMSSRDARLEERAA